MPDPWPSPARRPGAARGLQLRHRCTALYTITRYLEEAPSPCWKCLLKVLWTTRVKSPNVLADRLVYDEFLLIVSESVKVLEDLS